MDNSKKMAIVERFCRPVVRRAVADNPKRFEIVDEMTGAHISTVSDRYALVNNADVIRPIVDRFGVEGLTRLFGYGGGKYTYGEIFTGREFEIPGAKGPDTIKERLIFQNSYDKTKRLVIMLGAFRAVCANGLYTGTAFVNFRTRHVGDVNVGGVLDEIFNSYGANNFDLWRNFAARPMSVEEETELVRRFNAFNEADEEGKPVESNIRLNKDIRYRAEYLVTRPETVDNRRDAYGLFNQLNRAINRTVTAKTAVNRLIEANLAAEEYVKAVLV